MQQVKIEGVVGSTWQIDLLILYALDGEMILIRPDVLKNCSLRIGSYSLLRITQGFLLTKYNPSHHRIHAYF